MRLQRKKLALGVRLWASGQLETPHEADDADEEVDAAMVAFNLQRETSDEEDAEPDYETYYLWPCNVEVWSLWWRIQTQWRVGAQGREGLNYPGVTDYLRNVARIRPRKMAQVYGCIQAMERAALDEWAKQRKKDKPKD